MLIPFLKVKISFLKEIQAQEDQFWKKKFGGLEFKIKTQNLRVSFHWAFGEEKVLTWLSSFGKTLTPLEEETYNFASKDEDKCQEPVGAKICLQR